MAVSSEEIPVPVYRFFEPFLERIAGFPAQPLPGLPGIQVLVRDLCRSLVLNDRLEVRPACSAEDFPGHLENAQRLFIAEIEGFPA